MTDREARLAFVQWRRAMARWQEDVWQWEWRWQWLEREQYDRRMQVTTGAAFSVALAAEAPERRALRAERPTPPPRPIQCVGLVCGARTRRGTPCQRRDLGAGARCRLHGGLSTGPTSTAGKRRVALNGRLAPRRQTPCAADLGLARPSDDP